MPSQLLGLDGRTRTAAASAAASEVSAAFAGNGGRGKVVLRTRSQSAGLGGRTPSAVPAAASAAAPGPSFAAPPAVVLAASALALPFCPSPRSYQVFRCLLVIVGQSEGLTGGLAPHFDDGRYEIFFRFDCTSSGWTARHQPQENVICASQPTVRRVRRLGIEAA